MTPEVTLVCCIEAGRLERQTLLMIRSLRRFGGKYAQIPGIAVVGRLGAPLLSVTESELESLGVQVVHAAGDNPMPWLGYANKVAAVSVAQRLARTGTIAWADSDILFAAEPSAFDLRGADFAARSEWLPPAIHRGSSANAAYWRKVCDLFGIELESVPWVDREDGRPEQRMYFNSGLFAWRKGSGFAQAYASAFSRLLGSRIAQANGAFHFADQVILTPVVLRLNLPWRHLSQTEHCMFFQGFISGQDATPPMQDASVIHYSKSLDEPFRTSALERLKRELPALHAWFEAQAEAHLPSRPARLGPSILRLWRGLRWRLYGARVRPCFDVG